MLLDATAANPAAAAVRLLVLIAIAVGIGLINPNIFLFLRNLLTYTAFVATGPAPSGRAFINPCLLILQTINPGLLHLATPTPTP
jgi:hypothetical protein